MRSLRTAVALAAVTGGAVAAALPLAAQTGLTIYTDGRVLVRRTLPLSLGTGLGVHRLSLGTLDPASVFPLDSGVVITGANYDESVDETNTMRRAVGQTLKFWTGRGAALDTVTATVVGVNPERFKLADGRIVFNRPGMPLYPAELVLVDPTLALTIRSAVARPALRLGYFTDGAAWTASYSVVLGKATARISGLAAIPSASLRVSDAEVQLLAGSVGLAKSPMARQELAMRVGRVAAADMAQSAAVEQQIGEAHLYSIPGRISLEPGVTASVALFDPASAPWERAYVVHGHLPWYGPLPQYGAEDNQVPVEVWYTLKRQARTSFGDLPLPMGTYRLYEPDDAGRLQLIGEASAGHIAPGSDARLQAGNAFDLTATRVQLSYTTRRDSLRTIATADYRVTVKSAKDSVATVEVLEERGGEWTLLSSSVPGERVSSTRTRFRLRVPAKGEAVLTYRVRVVW